MRNGLGYGLRAVARGLAETIPAPLWLLLDPAHALRRPAARRALAGLMRRGLPEAA